MSTRTLLVHALFCALAAVLAVASSGEPESTASTDDAVKLLDLKLDDIDAVRFVWPDGDARIRSQDGGWVVELDHAPPRAPKDKSVDPLPRERFVFPAGRSVMRALDKLAPFEASRVLGILPKDKLEEMQLAEAERTLEITSKGKTWTYEVGVAAPGKRARYIRERGAAVMLVDDAAVRGLEGNPARLQETRVVTADVGDIVAVTVTRGDKTLEVTHQERAEAKERYFAKKGAPDERSEEADAMVRALRGLRVTRYVSKAETDGAEPRASWSLALEDQTVEVAVLERAEPAGWFVGFGPSVGGAGEQAPWFAEISEGRGKRAIEELDGLLK